VFVYFVGIGRKHEKEINNDPNKELDQKEQRKRRD